MIQLGKLIIITSDIQILSQNESHELQLELQ